MRVKSVLKSALRALGFEVVRAGCGSNLILLETLTEMFRTQRIDLVIDVGANDGQFRDYLRKAIGFEGQIVSFEPGPAAFANAKAKAATDKAWDVYPFALGAENGSMKLNVTEETVFSSFLEPRSDTVRFEGNVVADQVDVPIRRLDDVMVELGIDLSARRAYLKCDTQGFDLHVLRGARQSLPKMVAFQSEISVVPIYEGSTDFLTALAEMRSYGFEVAALSPVAIREGRVVEFDCVMLNDQVLPREKSLTQ